MTAREALLEIRRRLASSPVPALAEVDEIAVAGLNGSGADNFELTDQLADRLAEAHRLLRQLDRDGKIEHGEVLEALALPPDLEAMVERRIGPT